MSRYGVSDSTSSGGQLARAARDELDHGARDDVLDRRRLAQRLLDDLEHRHRRGRGATSSRRVITTFASLACSRCATAGAAKPEKIGTWIAPMCAHACEATATSGDIGRKIATRSPGSDAERDERLGEPRHLARELGERERAARRRPRRSPTAATASGVALRPAVDAVARDR